MKIGDLSVSAPPEGLGTVVDLHPFDGQAVYLAEGFWCVECTAGQSDAADVPYRRPVGGCEEALSAFDIFALPKDVLALKAATVGEDMARLLESRFAFANGDVAEFKFVRLVERAFAVKLCVLNTGHFMLLRFLLSDFCQGWFRLWQ